MWMLISVLLVCVTTSAADYTCVCNYGSDIPVYSSPKTQSGTVGHLYEFDCKAFIPQSQLEHSWLAVAFQHMVGYVPRGGSVQIDACAGNPPVDDMTTVPSTHHSTTKQTSAATAPSTATTTKTVPSTTSSTTMVQTTTTTPPLTSPTTDVFGGRYWCRVPAINGTYDATQLGHNCYILMPSQNVSWASGERICQQGGGHLAYIGSAGQQRFLQSFLQMASSVRAVWIGLNDRSTETHFEWTNGTPVNYTNWVTGHTGDIVDHHQEDCVAMLPSQEGKWDDLPCGDSGPFFETHPILCQYTAHHSTTRQTSAAPAPSTTTPTAVPSTTSSTTMVQTITTTSPSTSPTRDPFRCSSRGYQNILVTIFDYEDYCYILMSRQNLSWASGERLCQQGGGHLAYIGSAGQQRYIQDYIHRVHSSVRAVWIGLNDRSTETHFEWTNGKPVNYTNWVTGHTGNIVDHHQEDCVAMLPFQDGKWDDLPCGDRGPFFETGETHPILCQYKPEPFIAVG